VHADHDNGSGGWNDTSNVFDGSWNRFVDVDAPWSGPVGYGPGNNTLTGTWNLCPGPDGAATGQRLPSIRTAPMALNLGFSRAVEGDLFRPQAARTMTVAST
jgi:hypothetical protein